jgi:starch-binding outer membrane protein, SusD/RagB family
MKQIKKYLNIVFVLFLVTSFTCCDLDQVPTDAISSASVAENPAALEAVLNGCYALFKDGASFNGVVDDNNNFLRQYYQMSDFASDDIVCSQVTEDPFFYSFTYTHSPEQSNARFFWFISYKMISGANTVIEVGEGVSDGPESIKQYIGEAYFVRALAHLNLIKFFAKPYTTSPSSPGVILRLSNTGASVVARATVAEVYEQIEKDLLKAIDLMNEDRGKQYASKEAAYALLSRVDLYMGKNTEAINFATLAIESGKYSITNVDEYTSMFPNALESIETIFAIGMTQSDNRGKFGSIASMIYSDGNSGWGEEFASSDYRNLLDENEQDIRHHYIVPSEDEEGNIETKNGIETYYITKFSFQNDDPNLASPIVLRLSEVYLNRAEAYAKLGSNTEALTDVDLIRTNRGLQDVLYNGDSGSLTSLEAVLKERRLELAFEGHRHFDLVRNGLPIERNYWGYHISGLTETDIDLNELPTGMNNTFLENSHTRNIYFIPIDEILANNLCTQNP